ncbi:MAG: endonuclease/exonuclease/phosphatase family protein [bacterium]
MKMGVKFIIIIISILFVVVGTFILFLHFKDYHPPSSEIIMNDDSPAMLSDSSEINLLTWNIGYAGLGKNMDFFYEGGKKVRDKKTAIINNLSEITYFLKNDTLDFILLQEVDEYSKRSHFIDETNLLKSEFNEYQAFYAKNYDIPFIPFPFHSPMGQVKSGLLFFSRYAPKIVERISFNGNYYWPKNLFMPDRCFLTARYPLKQGNELIIINTHNSAYDNGNLKQMQIKQLKDFMLNEYQQGHYIIAGGDWNQWPPALLQPSFNVNKKIPPLPETTMPEGWKWIYDSNIPSNRDLAVPYDSLQSSFATIDFFIVSPNVSFLSVETIDLKFENSDHQPVKIRCRLSTKDK